MTRSDLALRRLASQRLIGERFASIADAVRWFGAVQSQEYPEAAWAIAQRTDGITRADLDAALAEGAIIRTHVLRPTWHFVAPADLRWMLDLTAPRIIAGGASRWRQLELDAATFEKSNAVMAAALSKGSLTRHELGDALEAAGITTTGQRLPHLLMRAELDQVICSGGIRGKQFTYALFDDRVPKAAAMDRDEAVAELVRRYFTSHGPATPHDFAWWSGLTVKDARAGLAACGDALTEVAVEGIPHWFAEVPAPHTERPIAHLLPNYDEMVVAYRDHDMSCRAGVCDQLPHQYGVLAHPLLLDGQVVGHWKAEKKKAATTLTPQLLVQAGEAVRLAIEFASVPYGRFHDVPAIVAWSPAR